MSSSDPQSMDCALIGADSLLVECGEILLARGHRVVVVASGSPRVSRWARSKQLPVIDAAAGPVREWQAELAAYEFQWLFAITHLAMLPTSVLALPTRGAVNFHDGPLPRYAGLNTPAWALMRGEQTYGITWHVIGEGVDDGAVLSQVLFEIAAGETSLSLNTRNFEAAIGSFGELVDDLAAGRQTATPQDSTAERNVYRRADRPEAMAVLDLTRPVAELDRLVRALDFGPYPNPLGCAKLWVDGQAVIVDQVEVLDDTDAEVRTPGMVVSVDDERIVLAAGDGSFAVKGATTLTGERLTMRELADRLALRPGVEVRSVDDTTRSSWSDLGARLVRHEREHLDQLERLEAAEVPWAATPTVGHVSRPLVHPIDVATDESSVLPAAFAILLGRLAGKERFHVGLADAAAAAEFAALGPLVAPAQPFEVRISFAAACGSTSRALAAELDQARRRAPFAAELVARSPDLTKVPELRAGRLLPVAIRFGDAPSPPGVVLELHGNDHGWVVRCDEALVSAADAATFARGLETVAGQLLADPDVPVGDLDLLGPELRRQVLEEWNATAADVPGDVGIPQLFEQHVDRSPDATAVIFEDNVVSYRALDERANQLAHHLRSLGVASDGLVGIHVERSADLMVAVLGVLKAGGAYVPLDPVYPQERLAHMIRDSGCRVVISQSSTVGTLPADAAVEVVLVDADRRVLDASPIDRRTSDVRPHHLAYCIYTSGSTGTPKGVLVEHRNVVNFFVGMDEVVPHEAPAVWFAVTSLSFDISVLELLYTLTRGMTVVVHRDRERTLADAPEPYVERHSAQPIDFSLFYFSGDEETAGTGADKYRLLLEGARWADQHGFCAVWTPERHFHAFGGLYPQPAVTSAALAVATERIGIRAGSVVMPLNHPIRVAEEWSIVDNLSNGRVAISMASGWQPNDFVLMPDNFADAKQAMFDGLDAVKRLWRGERMTFDGPNGQPVEVTTLPRPVQPELPIWITTAGNPETYRQAGRIGANVLTHLLGQSVEQLAPKIAAYRAARAEAGFDPDAGIVTLMLHTFVGDDADRVRETVREPLKQYLGTSFSLLKEYAWAFPAFQRPPPAGGQESVSSGLVDADFRDLSAEELDAVLEFAFLRYYESSGLFGTPDSCREVVDRLKGIGVGEIACLVDFGVDTDTVLAHLVHLDTVRVQSNRPAVPASSADQSIAAQIERHGVTHLQCTPSMARMLCTQDDERAALASVPNVFIGGEAFPVALAKDLHALCGRVTNMYGPTETTIWSTTWPLSAPLDNVPIGRPIANTSIYILDERRQPLPPGVPGQLWIGGDGVVRGYHQRAELTAERFVADPFRGEGNRMYATGDLARWGRAADGAPVLDFLGRADHQVKIRGHRIELGEIEARLGPYPGVLECVAVVREDTPGDQQLVAYLSAPVDARIEPGAVKDRLREHLPEVMIPAHVVVLDALPHTPNGKIDRNALPSLAAILSERARRAAPVVAGNDVERAVLAVWEETLGSTDIGVDDNFFDIGGHSLLVVRMHRRLREQFDRPIALTDLYRFPTVRSFAASLSSTERSTMVKAGVDRAARRRDSLQRRRVRQ